jgi:hypothetical protein
LGRLESGYLRTRSDKECGLLGRLESGRLRTRSDEELGGKAARLDLGCRPSLLHCDPAQLKFGPFGGNSGIRAFWSFATRLLHGGFWVQDRT